jgi:hypothetical protein
MSVVDAFSLIHPTHRTGVAMNEKVMIEAIWHAERINLALVWASG